MSRVCMGDYVTLSGSDFKFKVLSVPDDYCVIQDRYGNRQKVDYKNINQENKDEEKRITKEV